jgi:hypothetical protein
LSGSRVLAMGLLGLALVFMYRSSVRCQVTLRPLGRPGFGLVGDISVAAVTAVAVSPLRRLTFFKRQKKISKKGSPRRPALAGARRSFAAVSIRGHCLRLASLQPTCSVFDCVERRCAPLPGCTPPLSLPKGRVDQSCRRANARPDEW